MAVGLHCRWDRVYLMSFKHNQFLAIPCHDLNSFSCQVCVASMALPRRFLWLTGLKNLYRFPLLLLQSIGGQLKPASQCNPRFTAAAAGPCCISVHRITKQWH